jgi:hypothetical protein
MGLDEADLWTDNSGMKKRSVRPDRGLDFVENALRIVRESTGAAPRSDPPATDKNPHAQALSALGASKGGQARAANLSARRKRAIAKTAAKARWGTKKPRR